jgi:hypothetical protein
MHTGMFLSAFMLYLCIRFILLDAITGDYTDIDSNMSSITLLLANLTKLVARNFTPPFLHTVFSIIFFILSLIVYGVAIVLMFKKNKSAGWLMIILSLGVISGVITAAPLGIDTHGNESERYIYYSSFFFCFFLAIATTLPKRKEWQYIIIIFIIASSITGLITYNANYRYTSSVTKTTLEFVKKYQDYKNAYFVDVPGEYKGSLIFRVCLPNAIHWIAPECKYDSIIIVSKAENANIYGLKDTLNRNIILNENDAVFWFTEKGLYKVRRP